MPVSGSGAWSYSLSADHSPESKLTQTRSRVEPRIAPAPRPGCLGVQQIERRSQSVCIIPGTLPRFRRERKLAHGKSLTFLPSFLCAAKAGPRRGRPARQPAVPRTGHRLPAASHGALRAALATRPQALRPAAARVGADSVPTRRARCADRARGHRSGLPRDGCRMPCAVARFRLRILSRAR